MLHQSEFICIIRCPHSTVADIADWNKFNRNVKIEPFNNIS
jgi:hypothetical protein